MKNQRVRDLSDKLRGIAVAAWDESSHPRDKDGKFGPGGNESVHKVPPELQNRKGVRIGTGVTTGTVTSPGLYDAIVPGMGMNADGLMYNLSHGSFTTITAANPMGNSLPDDENAARNEKLKVDLLKAGAIFHSTTGVYTNDKGVTTEEPSFMVHHFGGVTPRVLENLANEYDQESVLHYTLGHTTGVYTSGPNMGQVQFTADGFSTDPPKDAPQTNIPGAGKFSVGSDGQPGRHGFKIKLSDGKETTVWFGDDKPKQS